ncbi:MAG TPA: bifunctional homocysteine S-methyltransferase/methylenetetrahydrofolate reductase [Verrucomicrobiae bacterium]|jgi:methionine synthase I (cobalamin-dependent)/5,10-methylenetetrahydrofolate reductase|nr:bifunctional homocysteine S-methyltransferase/methylenetetrahydrofolate reductase [Verrucomicrobiae bacterium]
MRIDEFNKRLRGSVLVADGAMGSLLYETVGPQRCVDELNATRAEEVFRIHMAYLEAGAHIIETNTFGANRNKLAAFGLEERVTELNHRGVKIAREAREAAKHEVLIAGSIGPPGAFRDAREAAPEHLRRIFREQAEALEERGVDFFVLETFGDPAELLAAIEAIRSFSQLPIVAEMTYSEEGVSFSGARPKDAWTLLHEKGVQAIGANCSVGPQDHLRILQELAAAADSFPMTAMPNVGFPQRAGDRVIYPKSSPEYFDLFAREAVQLGARILGGCCGTTPDHIRAMVRAVKDLRPASGARSVTVAEPLPEARPAAAREPESALWRKIQSGKFVVSVEIDPPKGTSIDRVLEQVQNVMASKKVDAIDVNSGPLARVGMDALSLSGALEARGIETIPHLTTRDANLIGLQAMLLGAWTIGGVRNVLAVTGDPPSLGSSPGSIGVYEVDSIGLVKVLAKLNQGMDWGGKNLGGATNFTIGVAVNPLAEDLDEELRRFQAKVEAGAHFAMTQPIFDPDHWEQFLKRMGGKSPVPVLVGLWPLSSYKQALRLHNEVPGIVIPEPLLKQLEAAGGSAREHGFALGRKLLDWARAARGSGIAGAYLIPPFKRYEEILDLFQ